MLEFRVFRFDCFPRVRGVVGSRRSSRRPIWLYSSRRTSSSTGLLRSTFYCCLSPGHLRIGIFDSNLSSPNETHALIKNKIPQTVAVISRQRARRRHPQINTQQLKTPARDVTKHTPVYFKMVLLLLLASGRLRLRPEKDRVAVLFSLVRESALMVILLPRVFTRTLGRVLLLPLLISATRRTRSGRGNELGLARSRRAVEAVVAHRPRYLGTD